MIKIHRLINFIIMSDKTIYKFLVIFIFAAAAFAQPVTQRGKLHLTTWVLSSTKDSVTVSFTYAIPYNRLIFTKADNISERPVGSRAFVSNLSFSIDAADSATGINHQKSKSINIIAKDFLITQDANRAASDITTITLPKSVYKVSAQVRDDNQQISYMSEIETKRFSALSDLNSIILADSSSVDEIYPVFMNDTAPFPYPIVCALILSDSLRQNISLNLETATGKIIKSDSVSPQRATLVPIDTDGNVSLHITPSSDHLLYLAKFEIDSLSEGSYNIETNLNGKTEKFHINYLWLDKPLTLRNFKTALTLLKYLVPDSVFSYLNSGNDKEQREKFDQFWKSHDPTPLTAYNQLEAEYYQRADYAFDHFRTISAEDGDATDRGKAYILYGKPVKVQREFRNDGTYEIWYYPSQKKSLVFKEENPGNFILYRTENL